MGRQAFPSLPGWKRRLAARGIDAEASFRAFLGEIVGDANVDRVMERAARAGELPEPPSRVLPVGHGDVLSPPEVNALRAAASGVHPLSTSEQHHIRYARAKLGARTQTHAVAVAIRQGLLPEYLPEAA